MNNIEPSVDIILLNYNNANDTIECIKSLENIHYSNYRIIVVDNKSNEDDIVLLERNIGNHVLLKSDFNGGFSYGNNIGIKKSLDEGIDYFLLLNNDTTVEVDFLKELISLTSKDDLGIGISKIMYYSQNNVLWYGGGEIEKYTGKIIHTGINETEDFFNAQKNVTFASGCCMLIPRKVLLDIGFMREEYFLYYEDADYSSRVISAGYKIIYNPKSVIYHKVSASTGNNSKISQYYFSRNILFFIKNNLKGLEKMTAYFYSIFCIIRKIVINEYDFKTALIGIRDFILNKDGKLESNL